MSVGTSHSLEQQQQALQAAAKWYSQLCSGTATVDDGRALQVWLDHDEINSWAWSRVDQLQRRLGRVPSELALNTLERSEEHFNSGRRGALKALTLLCGGTVLSWNGYQYGVFEPLIADHYTGTGEVKSFSLADGTRLVLNTASAVDIQFTPDERRIILRRGEIMVDTGKDPSLQNSAQVSRPFIVQTDYGDVRALGTRFSVRALGESSGEKHPNHEPVHYVHVNVYQHSIEVTLPNGRQQLCGAGQATGFTHNHITQPTNIADDNNVNNEWTRKMLVVEDMALDTFLNELSRYRTGVLRCDPAVAYNRISGAFNVSNTDQALRAVEKSFAVRVDYRTRYWVSVSPR